MDNGIRISVSKLQQTLLMLFVLAPFLFPTGLQYSSSFAFFFDVILYYWRIAACGTSLLLFFYRSFKKQITLPTVLFFICICSLFFSTIIQHASISSFLSAWGGFFCFYVGAEIFLNKCPVLLCKVMKGWLEIIVIINLITLVVFPGGIPMDRIVYLGADSLYVWFWGFKNSICNLIIPYYAFSMTLNYLMQKKGRFPLLFPSVLSLVTAILSHSTTLLISVIAIIVLLLLKNLKVIRTHINPRNMAVIGVCFSVLIVFFNIQNIFSWLIEGVLGKDLSLSNRTFLWGYALQDISRSPFFGYGVQTSTTFGLTRYALSFSHCHNAILTLLYQGGLISLISYGVFFVYSIFKSESDSVLGYDYGLLLFIQLIIHISGSITGVGLFLILILISNMNKLEMIRANHNSLERVNEKSH